jgi:hypothetical protein
MPAYVIHQLANWNGPDPIVVGALRNTSMTGRNHLTGIATGRVAVALLLDAGR